MTTETDICNDALGKIGSREPIASLAENSNEAAKCSLFYASTRDEVLQKAQWGFATKLIALQVYRQAPGTPGSVSQATAWDGSFPAPPWLYSYAWPDPTDPVLAIQAIVPVLNNYAYPFILAAAAAFQVGSDDDGAGNNLRVILTNQADAIAVYTAQITDPNLFSPLFISAVSSALAARLAGPLTGDKDLMKLMYTLANQDILEARASSQNQGLTVLDQEAAWIVARDSYAQPIFSGNNIAPYAPLYIA